MDQKYEFGPELGGEQESNIAYVRPVRVKELPHEVRAEIREQAGRVKTVFAVHNSDGERLALVRDRNMAFVLARQNDLAPVSVH